MFVFNKENKNVYKNDYSHIIYNNWRSRTSDLVALYVKALASKSKGSEFDTGEGHFFIFREKMFFSPWKSSLTVQNHEKCDFRSLFKCQSLKIMHFHQLDVNEISPKFSCSPIFRRLDRHRSLKSLSGSRARGKVRFWELCPTRDLNIRNLLLFIYHKTSKSLRRFETISSKA